MDELEQSKLIDDVDALYRSYSNAGVLKRWFGFASFRKLFHDVLANHNAKEEALIRTLFARSRITADSPEQYISFLTSASEHLTGLTSFPVFLLLSCIFKGGKDANKARMVFMQAFDQISECNGVSRRLHEQYDDDYGKPLWEEPEIPCLLESLIQLISAEKSKYILPYQERIQERCCWHRSARNSMKLAGLALERLTGASLYGDMPVQGMVGGIIARASRLATLPEEDARSCENWREIQARPDHFLLLPGYAEIQMANAGRVIDFVNHLRAYMDQTGTIRIFQRYLAPS